MTLSLINNFSIPDFALSAFLELKYEKIFVGKEENPVSLLYFTSTDIVYFQ